MDLYCGRCGEPWDNDEFHVVAEDTGSDYAGVAANFRRFGCEAVTGVQCEKRESLRSAAASAMYDLLGDDMDGAAAMLDDFGL